jgi:hypothetical protein
MRARLTGCRQNRAARHPTVRTIRLPAAGFASRLQANSCHPISPTLPFAFFEIFALTALGQFLLAGRRDQSLELAEFFITGVL